MNLSFVIPGSVPRRCRAGGRDVVVAVVTAELDVSSPSAADSRIPSRMPPTGERTAARRRRAGGRGGDAVAAAVVGGNVEEVGSEEVGRRAERRVRERRERRLPFERLLIAEPY